MLLFVLIMGLAVTVTFRLADETSRQDRVCGRKRSFGIELAEGVKLSRPGYYGIDFVRCGGCRVEKRKLGGLTLGCFNVLVLDDLFVTIPPELTRPGGEGTSTGNEDAVSAADLAAGLGVNRDFLKTQGCPLKFSGLKISNLAVATLDAATNAIPRFSARMAEAKRDGLHLRECGIITEKSTNIVENAVLKVKPRLRLEWSGGKIDF